MDGEYIIHTNNTEIHEIDKKISDFSKKHKLPLSEKERHELGELLNKRAKVLSDILGVKIGSVVGNNK